MADETPGRAAPQFGSTGPLATTLARNIAKISLDGGALAAALALAYALRFDFEIPAEYAAYLAAQLPIVVFVQLGILLAMGANRVFWRYVGLADLPLFLRSAAIWLVPLVSARLLLSPIYQELRIPLSIILLDAVLGFGAVLGLRITARSIYESRVRRRQSSASSRDVRRPVIFVGAGRGGVLSVRELRGRGDADIEPVGFVDDDPLKVGSVIQGVPVLGKTADLPRLAKELGVDEVVVTIAEADRANIRRIVDTCEKIPLKVRQIPGYYDLLQGNVSIRRIRDVDVDDLLGRDSVELDRERLDEFLNGKSVMVTGAGGSIGSELARQIIRFRPSTLVLVERSEFALFEVRRRLTDLWPELRIVPRIGDITDEAGMRETIGKFAPEVIIHAAAHKHVAMMERQPAEAIKNNIEGTALLGQLAGELGVKTFVLVSTDKAVRPSSVMGASKRVAELVVQDLNRRYPTRYVAVRFGNVLGSTGSVVPIFTEQIARGGPVTVTHRDMTRYFMSISEAAQLVLSAATHGSGGEIFILEMGEPVAIADLAEKMIRLSGFEPYTDIEIVFTGKGKGEKLFEELGTVGEELTPTDNAKISIGRIEELDSDKIQEGLRRLSELARAGDGSAIRRFFNEFLEEARLESTEFEEALEPATRVEDSPLDSD